MRRRGGGATLCRSRSALPPSSEGSVPARFRRALVPAALALLALSACGRGYDEMLRQALPEEEDRRARGYVRALARGDTAAVLRDLDPSLRVAETSAALARMRGVVAGRRIEEMRPTGYRVDADPNGETRRVTYQLRLSGGGWAAASVASRREGGAVRVVGATLVPLAGPMERENAFRLSGKGPLHWLVLLLAVVNPLLCIWGGWLAARERPRRHWIHVVAALIGVGAFHLEWTTGAWHVTIVHVQLLAAAFQRSSPYDPWILTVAVPVGALWSIARQDRLRRQARGAEGLPERPATS